MNSFFFALFALVMTGVFYVAYQWQQAEAMIDVAEHELGLCGARLQNVLEDVRSDENAASLVDDLSAVPMHWLRDTSQ